MRTGIALLIALSSPSAALDLFVLDDGDSNTDYLVDELEGWGHTVTLSTDDFGFTEYDFLGTRSGVDIADYDAVIWLDGSDATFEEMGGDGLDALYDLVDGGGGLLLFGASGYQYSGYGWYDGYGSLIPLRSSEYTTSKTWSTELGSHPIADGYSTGETFEPDTGLIRDTSASSGTVVFTYTRYSTEYDAGVALGLGDGRLVQYAMWGNTTSTFSSYETDWSDDDVSQLVENALQWIVLRPPEVVLASSFTVAAEGSTTLRPESASDPDGGTVTYAWDIGSDGSTDGTSASYSFSAAGYDGPTSRSAQLTVTDDEGETTSASTTINITNVDPVIGSVSDTDTVAEGSSISVSVDYDDVEDADTHTISWDFGDGETGTGATVSHAWSDNDRFTVTVTVTDDDGGSDSLSFVQSVTNVAPTLSGDPDTTAYQGVAYSFTPTVTDPGTDDTFTFEGSLPAGATIDSGTGTVTWTPSADQLGDYNLTINVQDDDGGRDGMTWTVEVLFVDSDGDGMPDSWEEDYGLDPEDASDAAEDGDGDGRDNLDEYEGGTDPTVYEGPGLPTLLSPADGAETADVPPELQVENADAPLGQALTYGFQVYEDEALTSLIASVSGRFEGTDGTTEWQISGIVLDENTDYWWTATAADAYVTTDPTEAFSFFVNAVNEAPGAPGIYSPFSGGIVESLTPDLVLTAATDPDRDALTYRAVIETAAGDEVATVDGLTDDGSQARWSLGTELADETEYCWYGVAVDPDGLESPSSARACFFVDLENDPPTAPSILEPTDGSVVSNTRPTIAVADGEDPEGRATIHEFQVDVVETFDSASLQSGAVDTDNDGRTEWTPPVDLAEDTTWYARVRCNDGGEASAWVSVSFLVSADNAAPSTPALVSPSDGLEVGAATTFTVANAEDPEGDSLYYDFVVLDRLGGTVATAEGVDEGDGGQTSWTPAALPDGVYTWTSRAVDAGGAEGEWAAAWIFAVVDGEITGGGDGGDTGPSLDGLEIEGEGCTCASGGQPRGVSLAMLLGLAGLLGLRRRR